MSNPSSPSRLERVATALGLRSEPTVIVYESGVDPEPGTVVVPERERVVWTAPERASRVGVVFTAVGILATAIEQLSLDLERNGDPIPSTPFVDRPDPDMEREDWLHEITTSLALTGNAYLRTWRDANNHGIAARVMAPGKIRPFVDPKTGRTRYAENGREATYSTMEIKHLRFMKLPGELLGLGPIQAAQAELSGHVELVEASTGWIRNSGTPSGILSTEQALDATQRASLLDSWNKVPAGRTRLVSSGLRYDSLTISPKDAQFLESRRFSKTEIADMFGIPASLMLGLDKSSSDTYANVSQDWLGFVRFRLMRYVREIEVALSSMTPRGQRARFNMEALLRSDAETRFKIHAQAISSGIYSTEYARKIERVPETAAPAVLPATVPEGINA